MSTAYCHIYAYPSVIYKLMHQLYKVGLLTIPNPYLDCFGVVHGHEIGSFLQGLRRESQVLIVSFVV